MFWTKVSPVNKSLQVSNITTLAVSEWHYTTNVAILCIDKSFRSSQFLHIGCIESFSAMLLQNLCIFLRASLSHMWYINEQMPTFTPSVMLTAYRMN